MVNLALILHSGATEPFFSYPDYEAYRDHLHSFSGLIAESGGKFLTLSDAGGSVSQRSSADGSLAGKLGLLPFSASNKEFAATMFVSENYFSVLGVAPLRGRTFGDVSELAASPIGSHQRKLLAAEVRRGSRAAGQNHSSQWRRLYRSRDYASRLRWHRHRSCLISGFRSALSRCFILTAICCATAKTSAANCMLAWLPASASTRRGRR